MEFIVTDLDGTFLDDNKHFNAALFDEVLTDWEAAGNRFVIATGRELKWVEKVFSDFVDRVDIVSSNGSVFRPLGLPEMRSMIAPETLVELQDFIEQSGLLPTGGLRTYTDDAMYLVDGMGEIEPESYAFMSSLYDGVDKIKSLAEVKMPVSTVTGRWPGNHEDGYQVMEAINQSGLPLFATTSGYGTVDILPEGVNKAIALDKLVAALGTTNDHLVAFGDGMNDYEMLKHAYTGYVMPNGNAFLLEQEEFKHAAFDNNHDGVLKTIQAW